MLGPVALITPIIKQDKHLQGKHPVSHNAPLFDKHFLFFYFWHAMQLFQPIHLK